MALLDMSPEESTELYEYVQTLLGGESIDVEPGSGHFVWLKIPMTSKHAFIARNTQEPAPVETAGSCATCGE